MHEISIAGAIIDSVLDAAKKNNAIKVNEVFLKKMEPYCQQRSKTPKSSSGTGHLLHLKAP
ncbi:MAG: hypothetical protein KKG76_09145 [Euryarchaeota archaeon]|nr:hypothetical protein [Euryarchaeota archaeon]